jgi:hypothetical protein
MYVISKAVLAFKKKSLNFDEDYNETCDPNSDILLLLLQPSRLVTSRHCLCYAT